MRWVWHQVGNDTGNRNARGSSLLGVASEYGSGGLEFSLSGGETATLKRIYQDKDPNEEIRL